MTHQVKEIKFSELVKIMAAGKGDGLVFLGAGGDAQDWITGIPNNMKENGLINIDDPEKVFTDIYQVSTSGGRTDLIMMFDVIEGPIAKNMGKIAMWRLMFGDCCWASDYLTNYENQHIIQEG